MAYQPKNANGQATMANSEPVVIASDQSAVPVSFTGSTDVATQTTLAAINAKLVHGTDIGDVTINNAGGVSAVNIQDGGNSLTVDGTFWQATQPVSLATAPVLVAGSAIIGKVGIDQTTPGTTNRVDIGTMPTVTVAAHAVTNAGTFVVQENGASLTALQLLDNIVTTDGAAISTGIALVGGTDGTNAQTLAVDNTGAVKLATGSNTIGAVNIAAAQTLATVTTVGTVTTCSTVTNLSQLGGVAIDMNTGVRATGTQRVTVATDDIVQVKTLPDATATYAPTNATTSAYATNLVVKASAGNLFMLSGYNSKTSAQFVQIHNTASLPIDTSVPVVIFYVPGQTNFSFDFGKYGRNFATGITVCNSSTGPTKTIGSADCWFDAQYK